MSYFIMQMEEALGGNNEMSDPTTGGTSRVSTVPFAFPATAASITAAPSHLDRADENRGTLSAPPKLIDNYAPDGKLAMRAYPNLIAPLLFLSGYTVTISTGTGTNAVNTITTTGVPTGGTFTLTYGTEVSEPIPYNATAQQLQDALTRMRFFSPGDVVCAAGPLPTGITLTYQGRLSAKVITPPTPTSSLTGGTTPLAVVTNTTPGTTGAVLDPDGNGIPAGAQRLVFAKRATAAAKTAQITEGFPEHSTFIRGSGFGVSQFAMTAEGEVTVDLMGLYTRRIADPVLSAVFDAAAVLPLRRGDLTLTWLGGSAFTQDFGLSIANPIERGDHLGIASYYPKVLEHTGNPVRVSGTIKKRTIDPDDYDAMIDARTFAATARWISPSTIGATGKSYGMWVEMAAAQYTGGDPDDTSNARRFGADFTFEAAYDEAAANDAKITLVCALATMETFV